MGEPRIHAHTATNDELIAATQRQWEIIESESREDPSRAHHYLACATASSATDLRDFLLEYVKNNKFHPIHHSIYADTTCYLLHCTLAEVVSMATHPQVEGMR